MDDLARQRTIERQALGKVEQLPEKAKRMVESAASSLRSLQVGLSVFVAKGVVRRVQGARWQKGLVCSHRGCARAVVGAGQLCFIHMEGKAAPVEHGQAGWTKCTRPAPLAGVYRACTATAGGSVQGPRCLQRVLVGGMCQNQRAELLCKARPSKSTIASKSTSSPRQPTLRLLARFLG